MSFDLSRILDGKRALRRTLAGRPVAEKLAMLDVLRDRVRAIRSAAQCRAATEVRESSPDYRVNVRNP